MSYKRSDWPLTEDQLRHVIALRETTLYEHKREWPDLTKREGQAKLARQVMAMANTVGPEELAVMVFGVEDEKAGGAIVGVIEPPTAEAVTQILSNYAHPPMDIQCRHYQLEGRIVSGLAVFYSPTRPHYCLREHPAILSTRDVYVRRDRQVGMLTVPELDRMIRDRLGAPGVAATSESVEFGFIEVPDYSNSWTAAVRVTNLTSAPLANVWVIFDVSDRRDPAICHRARTLSNASLQPGEARETELSLSRQSMYKYFWVEDRDTPPRTGVRPKPEREFTEVRDRNHIGDGWFDITVTLLFRGATGLIEQRRIEIQVTGT